MPLTGENPGSNFTCEQLLLLPPYAGSFEPRVGVFVNLGLIRIFGTLA